jgi:hypothetical protein
MNRKLTKNIAWAAGLLLLTVGISYADDKPSGLEGTSWKVDVNPDGMAKDKGEKDFHDTFTFADDNLMTSESQKLGFGSAPYKLSRSGDKDWGFSAEQASDTQGTYHWSGTIHGGDMRGKLVWTKPDGTVLTYTFKGDKKT